MKYIVQLTQLHLKNFRCFSDITVSITHPIVLIEGLNGSGKTSLLEALHYVCYLRSFRTHTPKELLHFGQENFFLAVQFTHDDLFGPTQHELQVGFSGKKRLVKLNQTAIQSYKELLQYYRVVTLTEEDLELIKGGPEIRRSYIDAVITLYNPDYLIVMRRYKKILEQRNALLAQHKVNTESYDLWSEQLWQASAEIQHARIHALMMLERDVQQLIEKFFAGQYAFGLTYTHKKHNVCSMAWADFRGSFAYEQLKNEEFRFARSLVGAHLDDIAIMFQDRRSRLYASRGQQKLIVLLLKIAQIIHLRGESGPILFLLDDFMTDFDEEKSSILIDILLSLHIQLIFTSPVKAGFVEQKLLSLGAQKLKLPI